MMRVIFLLLVSSIALQSKSQTWNNYLQKRFKSYGIWADSVLLVPNDTSLNKTGFAIKGSTAYIGDGVKWTAITGGSSVVDSLVYTTLLRLYKVNDSMKVVYSNLYGLNISNTNLRLTDNRSLSGGAGASNGYGFTYDSLASLNLTRKSDGLDFFYIGQDGNLILSNDVGEVLNIGSDGALNLSNKIDAFDANISRVELSAGSDTSTFNFKARTKIKAEKVNPNNGSSYKILVRNDASNEVEYVDAVNVDTTVLATKAYVNYKDDIQQGFIDMRKLESDSSADNGYTSRARLKQYGDSLSAAQAVLNGVQNDTLNSHNTRILANQNAANTNAANINLKVNKSGDVITGRFTTQSLVLNKDSIPITSTNRWLLAIDTTTGRVQRIWYFTALPDTTISSNYTLTSRDIGRSIYCTNTSLITITIPTGLTTGLINLQDRRCNIGVYQEGTGNGLVQFAGSGVTLQSTEGATKTRVANSYAEIKFKSDTVVKLVGDII